MLDLDSFLRAAKKEGASDQFLVALLKERGFPTRVIYERLGALYSEASGVAIPDPPSRLESAREAFFHLLAFATLGAWVFALGSIWFELIERWMPCLTVGYLGAADWRVNRIAWQMASIMVAFPAFLWATRAILADQTENPDKAESGVRRWLTNLALLLTALVFIGDLVSFLSSFLQGELTFRFAAKSAVVFILAAAVFLYYSRGLNQRAATPRQWHRLFAFTSLAAILLSLALGFSSVGSPAAQRLLAEDRRRTMDLYQIAEMVGNWYRARPPELRRLPNSPAGFDAMVSFPKDPVSQQPYEYLRQSDDYYQLCAVFNQASPAPVRSRASFWTHAAGRQCFTFQAGQPPTWPPAR